MAELAKEIIRVNIEDEMRQSYLDYAMSVIVGRALPDVRDGLKPVHRRVLYGMHETNNVWNRAYVKCARVVGEVMGKYHPHGDSSIYDALVRMAQAFSMRNELVDGQGNFGSVDDDPAAAMRYCVTGDTRVRTRSGTVRIDAISPIGAGDALTAGFTSRSSSGRSASSCWWRPRVCGARLGTTTARATSASTESPVQTSTARSPTTTSTRT